MLVKLSRLFLFVLALGCAATGGANAAQVPPSLVQLLKGKRAIAADLARQVAMCSSRRDTSNPAFKGCVDWHSAVHGVWALVAYERATGDHQYAHLISSILSKQGIEKERAHIRNAPMFEMPYGRAWFLRLALEYHALTGSTKLQEMGDDVAISLRNFYRRNGINPLSGAYQSASWALINLFDYARYRKNEKLKIEVTNWIKQYFVSNDLKCPYSLATGEFMAICTNWAALVSRVLDHEAYSKWLDRFIKLNGLPSPIIRPSTPHESGLNFSRAWGLWDMYNKSGRADVVNSYVAHFEHGYRPKTNWSGSYYDVGHWVAQFGIFALQPLFGPKTGR